MDNVQVIYTKINRDKNGSPSFENFYYNRKDARYFYPASTVKLPIVLLALEKLHTLSAAVTANSTMITESDSLNTTSTYNDPNTVDGRPSIAQYIKEVLLVSDNNAFNRLYEFLGQKYINDALKAKGYASAQILHRGGIVLSPVENRHTNPISFYNGRQLMLAQPAQDNKDQYEQRQALSVLVICTIHSLQVQWIFL